MKLEEAILSGRFADEKHKATINILYTAYWLKDRISTLLKKEDLTMEQYNVLRILKGQHPEPLCVKDIAARIIEKSSNVPRIVDRLVIKKLVKRAPSKADKRETHISLTEKGITVLESATMLIEQVNDSISAITESESKQLNELLEKMRM